MELELANAKTLLGIQEALSYALKQMSNTTEIRLVNSEFWNSLNRKGMILNSDVSVLIDLTWKDVKLHKK